MIDKLVLTKEASETVVDGKYKEFCEYSEQHETDLSPKWWNKNRPADRKRYFNSQYQDIITEAISLATVKKVLNEVESKLRLQKEAGYRWIWIEDWQEIKKALEEG